MSQQQFRQTALQLAGASEGAHQGHADFRVSNRVFATLGYPDERWGMVKFTPQQQAMLVAAEPEIFRAVPGGWGKSGSTNVNLATADSPTLRSALTMAWTNILVKDGVRKPAKSPRVARAKPKVRR